MIENKIQEAIKPIIEIYTKIELELLDKIATHFNVNEEFINSDYWYIEKLKELGGLNTDTLDLLQRYTGRTRKELLKAMQDIGINSIPTQQLEEGKKIGALLDTQAVISSTSIQDLIRHSYNAEEKAFLQLNEDIAEATRQVYQDIATETFIKLKSGAYSYQEAILNSLDDLGNRGINVLEYQTDKGIRRYDVVGIVRRDLLVATRGLAGKINEEVIKESGHHIVRVTNHFGARTGDSGHDFTNHAWWQEMQFFCWNYDGQASEEEKKLPDFMEHCNYGDVQGIVGINCKHLFTVWYGPTDKKDLDFTYEENKEQYEKTQQQRYLENGIRKWKRKQVVANSAGDEEGYKKASLKTKEWQNRIKEFTENNELKRDYTREHIKEYKASTNIKNDGIMSKNVIREGNNMPYKDITNIMLENKYKTYRIIKQKYVEDIKGNRYQVDGKHVIQKPSERERNVAEMLGQLYGKDVKLIPRISYPKNIKTPDYIIETEKFDLKEITGKGKYVIVGNIKGKQAQASNFIVDISKSDIEKEEALRQIEYIYKSKRYEWVKKVFLLKDNKFLRIYDRQ